MTDERCPYCGAPLDDYSVYKVYKNMDLKYACNNLDCVATAWTEPRWRKEMDLTSMNAQYL